jgi:pyruvoyl-dependent arginine decarboxylase (PvlArgDC)
MVEGLRCNDVALLLLGIAWLNLIQVFLIYPRDIPEYLN